MVESEQLVRSYGDIWNDREYSKIPDLVSETFVLYDPAVPEHVGPGPAGEAHGPAGLEAFIKWLDAGFPDFQITILELLASDDIVMDEVRFTGTHKGAINGLPPTDRTVGLQLMGTLRIEDGHVKEHRVYFNQREFAEQLGLTFPTVIKQLPKLLYRKVQSGF